ncbi:MAG: hypothetical protein KDJ38_04700 [Gammaproteobacteria bacterium]|nr:hypothetical protein [Gammaproteobacteria bacterium]
MSTGKFILFSLLSIILPLTGLVLLFEITLRFLPVQSATAQTDVSDEQPIARFQPDNDVTFSIGWNFKRVVKHQINNDGFANQQDYFTNAKPTVAVIGDSYVEAFQVPFEKSFHGLLQKELADSCNVYSFGISGAPLSQYIAWAQYARQQYQPSSYVFNIISNDFDESFKPYSRRQGYWLYDQAPDGKLTHVLEPKSAPPLKKIVRHSALARYLFANVQILDRTRELFNGLNKEQTTPVRYVSNRRADFTPEEMAISKQIVDQFLDDVLSATGLPPESIVFSVDGIRQAVYGDISWDEAMQSYVWIIKQYFIARAQQRGFTTIDMNKAFTEDFRKNHQRFEFPYDWHWNEYGHAVVFREISKLDWSRCSKPHTLTAVDKSVLPD